MHSELFLCFAGTVIRDEMGLTLEKASQDVLGSATKVVITNNSTLIVTDGSTRAAVEQRVSQIRKLVEVHLASLTHTELCNLKFFTSHRNTITLDKRRVLKGI